jgi:hypothetical protein
MTPYCDLLLCLLCMALLTPTAPAQANKGIEPTESLSFRPNDPLNRAAFDHFYNLDYDRAVQ